jgi:hypothetical protein
MKRFKEFISEEMTYDDIKYEALKFINLITTSSKLGTLPKKEVLSYLAKTKKQSEYNVFRGIRLFDLSVIDKNEIENNMSIGSEVLGKFTRPNNGQAVIHTTHDLSIAENYAECNQLSLVYQMTLNSDGVIFDSNGVLKIFDKSDLLPEDYDYFRTEKEVLVYPDADFTTKIISLT